MIEPNVLDQWEAEAKENIEDKVNAYPKNDERILSLISELRKHHNAILKFGKEIMQRTDQIEATQKKYVADHEILYSRLSSAEAALKFIESLCNSDSGKQISAYLLIGKQSSVHFEKWENKK